MIVKYRTLKIERRDRVVSILSYSGGCGFKSRPRDILSLLRFSCFFSVTPDCTSTFFQFIIQLSPINPTLYYLSRSRGSSVSIVSDYGVDDRAIGVRSPAGAKDFSSNLCVQIGTEAHPSSCTMGTGGPFPWQSAAGA
jgi:hypothetical protein